MKKTIVIIWVALIFIMIGRLFWFNDWVYRLPTPVPSKYKVINQGEVVKINFPISDDHMPVFLHFFNPGCPCSRFNMANFKRLYKEYKGQINFKIVVMSSDVYTVKAIQNKFDLNIPVLFDPAIATACGVYSTPQVALLDASHKLYYRGNYNKSRYCTDEKTNYAKTAIAGLINNNTHLVFSRLALKSYGCQLPNCTR
jgi:hypothetical protein